eukprot:SAG31_NODE_1763_length_7322_cov_21.697633_6_plen_58_part_00
MFAGLEVKSEEKEAYSCTTCAESTVPLFLTSIVTATALVGRTLVLMFARIDVYSHVV